MTPDGPDRACTLAVVPMSTSCPVVVPEGSQPRAIDEYPYAAPSAAAATSLMTFADAVVSQAATTRSPLVATMRESWWRVFSRAPSISRSLPDTTDWLL